MRTAAGIAVAGVAVVFVLPVAIVLLMGTRAAGACAPAAGTGGTFTQADISALWVRHGGDTGATNVSGLGLVASPVIAGAVGMAESGGDPTIVNGIGAGGLMQIHPPESGYLDADTNMRIAVRKWRADRARGGSGWGPWEAFTGRDGRGDDGPWRSFLSGAGADTVAAADCAPGGAIDGSPKQIIDTVVLPLSRAVGVPRSVAENDAANERHGPTTSGGRSDHQGPPDEAWAADMSNGTSPTPEMDRLATALAERFGLRPLDLRTTGVAGSRQESSRTSGGYRIQLIYRSRLGGNHDNHVHLGVRRAA